MKDMAWKSMWVAKSVMWEEVESKLREIYKYGEKYAPDTLVIQIGEKQYFVHVDNSHGYSKFQLKDEYLGGVIKM